MLIKTQNVHCRLHQCSKGKHLKADGIFLQNCRCWEFGTWWLWLPWLLYRVCWLSTCLFAVKNHLDEEAHPLSLPDGWCRRILWVVTLPLALLMYLTIPDCRRDGWARWFIVTFTMGIVWIAVYSYVMVWMITIIGKYTLTVSSPVPNILGFSFFYYHFNLFTTIHDGNFRRHSSMNVTIKWHKFSSNIYYIYVFFVIWSWKLR